MNLKDIDLNHIAIIMDGNGRWATNQGLDRTAGHAAGEFSLSRSIDWSLDNNLEWLTVFAFSTENWKRSRKEISFLMTLLNEFLDHTLTKINENSLKVRFIGDLSPFEKKIQDKMGLHTKIMNNITLEGKQANDLREGMLDEL